jgi:hypothetical protein
MISSILTFLASVFNFLKVFNLPSKQIKKVVKIYDAMHYIVEKSAVERILITKAHNSGGWINPNTPLYISVLYEDYTEPLDSVKSMYQKMEIDEDYLRMLRDLSANKTLLIHTKQLKQGILKDAYQKDKILHAEVHYLGQDRRNMYFCTIVTTKDVDFDNYADRSVIQIGINDIKNNIR